MLMLAEVILRGKGMLAHAGVGGCRHGRNNFCLRRLYVKPMRRGTDSQIAGLRWRECYDGGMAAEYGDCNGAGIMQDKRTCI